jgi:hypothetical protein
MKQVNRREKRGEIYRRFWGREEEVVIHGEYSVKDCLFKLHSRL